MNQAQPYMDVHSSHQPYTTQSGPVESVPHYAHYQPPVLHHGSYGHGSSYQPYGYPNGVSSSATSQPMTNTLAPPMQQSLVPLHPPPMTTAAASAHSYPASTSYPDQQHQQQQERQVPMDTTGQVAPPDARPKVSATLWEDEGTLCYQIEAKGICVARRDDNHMVNGTKLLNVAGMTRGRRDGILKSEKNRYVVKIGPMHLKGVWIPFERALEMANKEHITAELYPLFVHNLKAMVEHHSPEGLPNGGSITTERRRLEAPRTSQPAMHHHHHSLSASHVTQPQSLTPQTRPQLDRAHTFPTPPTSVSSLIAITHPSSSYEWSGHVQGPPPLSVESTLNGARSLPTTPATTPSGSLHHYSQQYDSKSYYPPPTSQPHYAAQPMQSMSQANGHVSHATSSAEGHTQEAEYVKPDYVKPEYVNDNSAAYNSNRSSYGYSSNATSSALSGEPPQISPEITSAPQPNGTIDRAPSRQSTAQWAPPTYPASQPRNTAPNLYSVLSDTRGSANMASENYATPPSNGSSYPVPIKGSNKRSRDDGDNDEPPSQPETHRPEPTFEYKRRKTISDSTVNGVVGASVGLQSVTTGAAPRRR